jgi:hypothetical protein
MNERAVSSEIPSIDVTRQCPQQLKNYLKKVHPNRKREQLERMQLAAYRAGVTYKTTGANTTLEC